MSIDLISRWKNLSKKSLGSEANSTRPIKVNINFYRQDINNNIGNINVDLISPLRLDGVKISEPPIIKYPFPDSPIMTVFTLNDPPFNTIQGTFPGTNGQGVINPNIAINGLNQLLENNSQKNQLGQIIKAPVAELVEKLSMNLEISASFTENIYMKYEGFGEDILLEDGSRFTLASREEVEEAIVKNMTIPIGTGAQGQDALFSYEETKEYPPTRKNITYNIQYLWLREYDFINNAWIWKIKEFTSVDRVVKQVRNNIIDQTKSIIQNILSGRGGEKNTSFIIPIHKDEYNLDEKPCKLPRFIRLTQNKSLNINIIFVNNGKPINNLILSTIPPGHMPLDEVETQENISMNIKGYSYSIKVLPLPGPARPPGFAGAGIWP